MKYTRLQAAELLQAIVDNEPRLDEWDGLLSAKHRDPFTAWLAARLLSIEENFSATAQGRFLDDQGIEQLKGLIAELRNAIPEAGSRKLR
jgi:hypothetical protein